jgi:integrase
VSVQKSRGKYFPVLYLGPDPTTGKRLFKWYEGHATLKEAQREERRLRREQDQGRNVNPTRQSTAAFLERWLRHARQNVAPQTYQRYKDIVDARLVPAFGRVPLAKLNTNMIQEQVTEWCEHGATVGSTTRVLSPQTIVHYVRCLHTALEAACDWGDLAVNPATRVKKPQVPKREGTILSVEQSQELIELAPRDDVYAQASLFAALTGLRQGEELGLRWRDVDLAKREVSIRQTLQQLRKHVNPSGRHGSVIRRMAKTRASHRSVALGEMAIEILERVKRVQIDARMGAGSAWIERDLVLANPLGEPLNPQTLRRRFRKLLAAAGVPGTVDLGDVVLNVRFHDLRHGHATHQIEQGVPITDVSAALGHSRTSTTSDIYAHALKAGQHAAAARFDQLMRSDRRRDAV